MAEVNVKEELQEEAGKIGENSLDMSSLEAPETDEEKAAVLADAAKSAEVLAAEEAAKVAEAKAVEDAEIAAAAKLKEAEGNKDTTAEDIKELRSMLRDIRNENIRLKATVERHEKVQKGDLGENIVPGELEELQTSLQELAKRDFSQILAVMGVNPKYEDVSVVCSKSHFEDIFEVVASSRVDASGGKLPFDVALLQAKNEVWGMANPYKYMYEIVKEYHPDYAVKGKTEEELAAEKAAAEKVAADAEKALKGKTAAEIAAEAKKAVKVPGSIAAIGGGAPEQGGWTAARIDELPEEKLHTVPKDIYAAYLRGELDK
jgi:hypothetical protein